MKVVSANIPKIHLLISVYLTDERLHAPSLYNDQVSKTQNRVEQFLSTIYSLKSISFNSAEIHYEVSTEYYNWISTIDDQIRTHIPNAKVYSKRLEYFNDWQEISQRIPKDTEVILLKTNHDHVFLHDDPSLFYKFIRDMNISGQNCLGEISHWPEAIGNSWSGKWVRINSQNDYYMVAETQNTIGTCLVNQDFFKSWWMTDFTGGARIVRPDNPFGPSVNFSPVKKMIPNCEFFRHMDGYGHVKIYAPVASPIRSNLCIVKDSFRIYEWTKGDFFLSKKKYDLPPEPKLNAINSQRIFINLALLATSYKVSFRNLWHLSQAFEFKSSKYLRVGLLFVCLTNKYFLLKLFTRLFRIDSIKYRIGLLREYFNLRFN
jgi:hypothetical protein